MITPLILILISMLKLKYNFEHKTYSNFTYDILQIKKGEPYQFFAKDKLVGAIEKINGKWEQTSGRQTLDEIVEGIGALIEQNT